MKIRSLASFLVPALLFACGSDSSSTTPPGADGGPGATGADSGGVGHPGVDGGPGATGPSGTDSGSPVGNPDSGTGGGHDGGPGNTDSGTVGPGGDSGPSSGPPFAAGTICNKSGQALTPPSTVKHLIVFIFENENFGAVNGSASAPYMNSIASQCGYASQYVDNVFADNLVSLPHYLALTSGSNCNTGLDLAGTGCIIDDNDATSHTLTTTSIFQQVSSWKAYQEGMPSACDMSSGGTAYACKHNPPAYFSALTTCSANDIPIAAVTCDPSKKMTACGATPSNAFTTDLANDTLPAFSFVTPNLDNDMHDGTVTQGDNWLYTYLPLVLQSKAYLNGEVAISVIWDEQDTSTFGGPSPNFFVSPYIKSGTVAATTFNHFAVLRAWENALGITTYLGCASGTAPGGGSCPSGSTADVRAALNF